MGSHGQRAAQVDHARNGSAVQDVHTILQAGQTGRYWSDEWQSPYGMLLQYVQFERD